MGMGKIFYFRELSVFRKHSWKLISLATVSFITDDVVVVHWILGPVFGSSWKI